MAKRLGTKKISMAGRFGRSERGTTVVEFAILGPLFFGLIGATMETAVAFFAGYALDAAVIDTSRLIRINQSSAVASADNYRTAVCGKLYGMFDCDQLQISVRDIPNFANFSVTSPIDPITGDWTITPVFQNPGASSTNMMIEAYYKWPIILNIPGLNIGQTGDGKRLLAATHVVRTEPSGS